MQPTYMRSVSFLGKYTSGSRSSARRSDLLKLPNYKMAEHEKGQDRELFSLSDLPTPGKGKSRDPWKKSGDSTKNSETLYFPRSNPFSIPGTIYLPTFFLIYRSDIFLLRVPGFFVRLRWYPKMSKAFRRLPSGPYIDRFFEYIARLKTGNI